MIIFDNEDEKKVVLGILGIVARNCNNYWTDKDDIDVDKWEYENYRELKEELETKYNVDNVDLVKILYKFFEY
tara:strand:+ start:896 stop:1114 length:219 start_codon:yes stop_codon:yes gene_type:complete